MDNSKEAADGDRIQSPLSAEMLYGSLISQYRATGVAKEEDEITKVDVGSKDIHSFEQDLTDFEGGEDKKAGASFDSIYSPYSTYFSAVSGLPHFEAPKNKTDPNSLTLNPFNPNNKLSLAYAPTGSKLYQASLGNSGAPSAGELQFSEVDSDPSGVGAERGDMRRANRTWLDAESEGWLEFGHNIKTAVNGTGNRYNTDFDYQFTESSGYDVEVTNIRGVGLRSPMVLTGWGFDIDGKPVPADTGDAEVFASGAFSNPSNWKSGPLDVRWDDERKVWAAGTVTKHYLVKMTNTYNPSHFSYEVQRSDSRSQYSRDTLSARAFSETAPIYDPEAVAYNANDLNTGGFERLDFTGLEYPHYEAFIIRETKDEVGSAYYNLFTDDCNDCGHITNSGCGTQHNRSSTGNKILIENPLRQSMNVGDLAFTVKTGRNALVNTGSFVGGSGTGADAELRTNSDGEISGVVTSPGSDYVYGGFAIVNGSICINPSLNFGGGVLLSVDVTPSDGYAPDEIYSLSIYPNNANPETEKLDIHWIVQAEFKSQQLTTHVEADGGILQTCTTMVQTQGFKSCEQCGEDLTLINNTR